jgi:hypothetical protein
MPLRDWRQQASPVTDFQSPIDLFTFVSTVDSSADRADAFAIESAWEASGFIQYFTAKEKYDREHPGHEEAEAKQYAATHGGKKKPNIRDLPERWQREFMTPDRAGPDFGETLRRVNDFDRRVNAERKLEEQARRNNGIRN